MSASSSRPNILVFMGEQHRADAMGCAGHPVVKTPNLDRLAGEGVRFSRAYCQGPLCMPARASFLTERYVRDHGVYENQWGLPADIATFLQPMREAGYLTGCIGKMHLYMHGRGGPGDTRAAVDALRKLGFDESIETVGKLAAAAMRSDYSDYLEELGLYDVYREFIAARGYGYSRGRRQMEFDGKTIDLVPLWNAESTPLPTEAYIDNWIGREAVRWIEEYAGDKPFFQLVGFAGPHDPWDAPSEYVDPYRDVEIPLGPTSRPEVPESGPLRSFLEAFLNFSDSEHLTDEAARAVRRQYYGNVTLIDECVGSVLAALERKGILDDTWIIYFSDHGEMLGDHRLLAKMVFYEPSVTIPLIVRPPGGMTAKVVDGPVEQLDVTATIRAIAGAGEVPGGEGQSLLGHLEEGGDGFVREVTHSENFGFGLFVTDRYKLLVWEDGREPVQLFDLLEDRDENHNVVADPGYAEVRERLMTQYVEPFLSKNPVRPGPSLVERLTQARG